MNKGSIAIIWLIVSIAILPQLLVTSVDAKGLPQYNSDYTRSQLTVMLVIPVALTGALALMLGISRKNKF